MRSGACISTVACDDGPDFAHRQIHRRECVVHIILFCLQYYLFKKCQ
jgi:hypothetical protein